MKVSAIIFLKIVLIALHYFIHNPHTNLAAVLIPL